MSWRQQIGIEYGCSLEPRAHFTSSSAAGPSSSAAGIWIVDQESRRLQPIRSFANFSAVCPDKDAKRLEAICPGRVRRRMTSSDGQSDKCAIGRRRRCEWLRTFWRLVQGDWMAARSRRGEQTAGPIKRQHGSNWLQAATLLVDDPNAGAG